MVSWLPAAVAVAAPDVTQALGPLGPQLPSRHGVGSVAARPVVPRANPQQMATEIEILFDISLTTRTVRRTASVSHAPAYGPR